MKLILSLLLYPILFWVTKGQSAADEYDRSCLKSHKKDKECGDYAYKIIKPMMAYFEQVNQEIDKNDAVMEDKNNQIRQLQEKVNNLNEQINKLEKEVAIGTSKDTIITMYADSDKFLKKQIELLTKSTEKQIYITCEKQNQELKELREKTKTEAEKAIQCDLDLKTKNELIISNDKKVLQLEAECKKMEDKTKKEIELLKRENNILNNSKDKLEKELGELKVKIIKSDKVKSCTDIDSPGVHNITLSNDFTFMVLCNSDIAGPGWTVIQQRIKGGVDFQKDWITYRNGFGDFWHGDFFLGLEKIHRLTNDQPHELYIHMKYFNGSTFFARYDEFSISDEDDQYRLDKLGEFSGSLGTGNALIFHKNMMFTTYDRDNDNYFENCATLYRKSGWWYNQCVSCTLNGEYFPREVYDRKAIYWYSWPTLKEVRMLIRPKAAI